MTIKTKIQEAAKKLHKEVIEIRRHLHMHPELSYEEKETSAFVCAKLKAWGIEYESHVAGYGIVALIKGKDAASKITALRADMDALPIKEANKVEYRSKNEGIMHACGHDVHTASLLGAANILNQLRGEWSGTVKLLFQPAEERLPGGASLMIKAGALESPKPSSIYGQHVHPPLEAGKIGLKGGLYMASADELHITVKGQGGHGALPQDCIDPVLIAAHMIVALQQIVSRHSNPAMPSVLTIGKVQADGATNVVPNEVRMQGTFRTMDEKWRASAHQKMMKMGEAIAESMGGSCDFEVRKGYPCLVNDEKLAKRTRNLAVEYLGEENVVDLPIRMTAEDFAYYTQVMPACFYRLGTGNKDRNIISPVHTDTFDIDEDALLVGMGLMAYLVVKD